MPQSLETAAWKASSVIDLTEMNSQPLEGRDLGEQFRRRFGLAAQDVIFDPVEVCIPESMCSISISFFLGMFGPSIKAAGNAEAFFSKYKFKANALLCKSIESCVGSVLLERRSLSR